jgi:hypothetical protein
LVSAAEVERFKRRLRRFSARTPYHRIAEIVTEECSRPPLQDHTTLVLNGTHIGEPVRALFGDNPVVVEIKEPVASPDRKPPRSPTETSLAEAPGAVSETGGVVMGRGEVRSGGEMGR